MARCNRPSAVHFYHICCGFVSDNTEAHGEGAYYFAGGMAAKAAELAAHGFEQKFLNPFIGEENVTAGRYCGGYRRRRRWRHVRQRKRRVGRATRYSRNACEGLKRP